MNPGLFADKYRIDSARRPGHDYSKAGQYFITICTQSRQPYFGQIQPASDSLNDAQLIGTDLATRALDCWQEIPHHFPFAEPDAFVVMPDHIHGILFFHRSADYSEHHPAVFGPQSDNLASVIRGFKVGVKSWATRSGIPFTWQPGYFDRVIRNDIELEKIRQYIRNNPNQWAADQGQDIGLFM